MFDAAALVVPFIPGTGVAKAGMKVADAADDVYDYYKAADRTYDTVNTIVDAGRAIENATEALKIGNKIDDSIDLVRNIENGSDTLQDIASTTRKLVSSGDDAANKVKQIKQAKNAKAKAALKKSTPKLNTESIKDLDISDRPMQTHHFLTNKNKTYTPQIERITNKYGLSLDADWNKEMMPHQGRHPNAYHEWMLSQVRAIDNVARGNPTVFINEFNKVKETVINNPNLLRRKGWR